MEILDGLEDDNEDFVEDDDFNDEMVVELSDLFDGVLSEEDDDLRLERAKLLVQEMNGE